MAQRLREEVGPHGGEDADPGRGGGAAEELDERLVAGKREQLLELVDDQHELGAVRRASEQPVGPPLQQLGVVLQVPGPRPRGRPHGRRQRVAQGGGEREERVAHLSGGGEGGEQPVLAAGQGAGAQPGQQAGVEQRGLAGAGIADDGEEAAGRVAQTRQQLVGLAAAAEEDGGLGLR